jgi:hypothetical protein
MLQDTKLLNQLRKVLQKKKNFPIGTLVSFGPDDVTITKIVAVVIPSQDSSPILKSWSSPEISTDPKTAAEIGQFFQNNEVVEVVMTDGVVGCPHEEGVDFPIGDDCPHCPFWAENPK